MKRRRFPYERVASLWAKGKKIAEIGVGIGWLDQGRDDGDRFHTLRNHLRLMHRGWRGPDGRVRKLPYRASRAVVKAAKARSM